MTLYITVESWTDGRPPALHIDTDPGRALIKFNKILSENNDGEIYEYLNPTQACEMYNRKSIDYFIHYLTNEI